jgi:hypothetical protein
MKMKMKMNLLLPGKKKETPHGEKDMTGTPKQVQRPRRRSGLSGSKAILDGNITCKV